ncbi:MAG: hypothetical protein DSO00_01940 [Archaeoglobi archaeon]|jgi:hypothetical protein|nr:MAG: hypothetical protein DSO00_01940 [Archaeoglobi archaeon]
MMSRILPLLALILLLSTFFVPIMEIEFREIRLLELAETNAYSLALLTLTFIFTLLSFNKPKFGLLAGILLLLLFLFLSFSKMHSPEYLLGYWALLASSVLLLLHFVIRRLNRKAY